MDACKVNKQRGLNLSKWDDMNECCSWLRWVLVRRQVGWGEEPGEQNMASRGSVAHLCSVTLFCVRQIRLV